MTMATITNSRALWFVGSFALVASLAFVSGYFAASMRLSGQLGEMAMGAMMQEVSALAYLERQDMPSAQRMLRMAVESNILAVSKSGTPVLDRYAPTSRAEWFTRYADIRSKYGSIDYADDGYVNRQLDSILDDARKSKSEKR